MMFQRVLIGLSLLLPAATVHGDVAEHRAALLEGISSIDAPGTPGEVLAFGEGAFSVVETGKAGSRESVVAAGEFGKGRLVLLCHGSYASKGSCETADTARFLINAADWASRARRAGRRVGLIRSDQLAPLLEEAGFTTTNLGGEWQKQLADLDLVVCNGPKLDRAQVKALQRFVRGGGGVIAMQTPWGWKQITGKSLDDNALNQFIAPAGLVWTSGYGSGTDGRFVIEVEPRPMLNATTALNALELHQAGETTLADLDREQASNTLTTLANHLPPDDRLIQPRLNTLRKERVDLLAPTESQPIGKTRPLDRCLLALDIRQQRSRDVGDIRAHPASESFPGAPPEGATRTRKTLPIDTSTPRWHSTGLYATPGRKIDVTIPPAAVDAGLQVRIGAHKDTLWHKARWNRVPQITRTWPLDSTTNEAACAFGGPVYIVVPRNCPLGTIDVKIDGAIKAPWFRLGTTTDEEWISTIREYPAPWAELENDSVILTVPSSEIRDLDNPEALMTFWQRILDSAADLRGWDRERASPERFVTDIQISAGYMHSGYPIMTHLDAAHRMTTLEEMQKGPWGLVHELGHNHQSGMWTFGGTVEVTCNLWSLYLIQKTCGIPWDRSHGGIANRDEKIRAYLAGGRDFNEWKRKPFLALQMYAQLVEAFDWEPFTEVFIEYDQLPRAERPGSEQEKRDQWMVRMSRATGHDLGPFFEAWGVPVSAEARAGISDLPGWMPPDWPQDEPPDG